MTVTVLTFTSVDEAERALGANRGARVIGGGTIVMRDVNAGDPSLGTLIRVTDPALRQIRNDGGRIVIGPMATMADVLRASELDFLSAPARAVGGPAVRNMATVAGNLFAPPPYGDFATALLALGATVQLSGTSAAPVPIDDFLRERERHADKLVRAVAVERPRDTGALRWLKVSRIKPKGVAVMSMAAYLPRGATPRVAYGNMGPTPLRALAVERALERATLSEQGIAPALAAATEGLDPPTDALSSTWYRREVAPVHLKRLLLGSPA